MKTVNTAYPEGSYVHRYFLQNDQKQCHTHNADNNTDGIDLTGKSHITPAFSVKIGSKDASGEKSRMTSVFFRALSKGSRNQAARENMRATR